MHGHWGYTAWHQVDKQWGGYDRGDGHTFEFWDKWIGHITAIKVRSKEGWYVKRFHVHVEGHESGENDKVDEWIKDGNVYEIQLN